jgi:hypothetical protein
MLTEIHQPVLNMYLMKENGPTITIADGGTLAYGDYYDPDSTNDNGFVWVVSRSTEE